MEYTTSDVAQDPLFQLIREELEGKDRANAGYDTILWKIRSGYLVALYGALGLVNFGDSAPSSREALVAIVLIVGFSLFGYLLDRSYVNSKLLVIDARDRLWELAMAFSTRGSLNDDQLVEVRELLHNAGDARVEFPDRRKHRRVLRRGVIIYGGSTLVGTLAMGLLTRC